MKKAYFLAWAAVAVRALFATAVSLDGTWSLSYRNQQDGGEWKTVAAQVPGDTFLAFEQNGILPELQRGTNVFGLFQYEQCEWKYVRNFGALRVDRGERVRLRFDGVDTRAEYFLNGEKIGSSENMFVPVELDVTGKLKDENVLAVHIKSPLGRDLLGVLGRTRVGGTDVEGIRKAQHMFGWDIMPRLVTSYPEQASWASGRNSLMTRQIENVFGSVPDELSDYVEQSQAVQAEALKYWVELSRSRKGRTWGLLWWNLRDGWPILSDGVVDWYYGKKLAYEYLKSVQQPQLVTCVDRHVGGNVRKPGRLVAVNDRRYAVSGNVSAVDCATKRELWSGKVEVPANGVAVLAEALPLAGRGMVRIEYVFEGVPRVNFCLYGEPPFDFGEYVNWRK